MRISGGGARGIPLLVPKGDAVRPATDKLRQAVFSSLALRVPGARFLDLFAGSGAYGLEALSRGAAGGTFVEKNPAAVACLRRNLAAACKSIGRDERGVTVITGDAVGAGKWHGRPAHGIENTGGTPVPLADNAPDLVFIDPPYEMIETVAASLFARLTQALEAKPEALVIFELPGSMDLAPAGWTLVKRLGKTKGDRQPTVAVFRKA